MEVIVAAAGGAAHLPGMLAAQTTLPVLGIPVPSQHLQGLDSLLSIVQMPAGRPRRDLGHRSRRRCQRRAPGHRHRLGQPARDPGPPGRVAGRPDGAGAGGARSPRAPPRRRPAAGVTTVGILGGGPARTDAGRGRPAPRDPLPRRRAVGRPACGGGSVHHPGRLRRSDRAGGAGPPLRRGDASRSSTSPSRPWRGCPERMPVHPSPEVVAVAQDRLAEKRLFTRLGIPTAPYAEPEHLHEGFPTGTILKRRTGGFDGRGQVRLGRAAPAEDLATAAPPSAAPALAEGVVDFARELSVVAARSPDGAVATYPVVENLHRDGILRETIAPAPAGEAWDEHAVRDRDQGHGGPRARRGAGPRAVRGRRRAAGQRARSAGPQLGPLDHRGRGHQPVRAAPAGDLRVAPRRRLRPRSERHGQPDRSGARCRRRAGRSGRAPPPLREGSSPGSQARPRHRGRRGRASDAACATSRLGAVPAEAVAPLLCRDRASPIHSEQMGVSDAGVLVPPHALPRASGRLRRAGVGDRAERAVRPRDRP